MSREIVDRAAELINAAPVPAKLGPPVAVNAMSFLGVSLDQWVFLLTIVWLVLQIGGWLYDRFTTKDDK